MATQKKITRQITLELDAGNAAMVEIGKMLGPTGINTRQVKLDYDEATAARRGDIIPVVVTIFEDRSFALRLKAPPTAFLIRKALGMATGSARPGTQIVATLSREQLREVAQRKLPDLNTGDIGMAMRQVAGTARSMGVLTTEE